MNSLLIKIGAVLVLAVTLYGCSSGNGPAPAGGSSGGRVSVNGVQLSQAQLDAYTQQYHAQIPAGNYWYDKISGAWGLQGGPVMGFNVPGLDLGGPLQANASNGNTGIFVNGRELPSQDVQGLQRLGVQPIPGRWWLQAD